MFKRSNGKAAGQVRPGWEGIADTGLTGVAPSGFTSEQRILELLSAIPESAATMAQLAEYAQDGAR